MQFHSAISDHESTPQAADRVIGSAREALGGRIDLAFVFFTAHHADEAEALVERLWRELAPQAMVGCSAEGVIGGDLEIEREPGLSLLVAACGAGVRAHPFHLAPGEWEQVLAEPQALRERIGYGEQTRAIIGVGDPFTTPAPQLLAALDETAPGAPLIGGMASSATVPGENRLVRNDQTVRGGFVGMSLSGELAVSTVVSQGCRPIGRPMVITRSHENIIEQLGGKPPMKAFEEMFRELPEAEQGLLRNGLFVGRAISEYRERFGRGDFLIRNVMGADRDSGAMAVGDHVRTGQTVQFHVRDAQTADEDLALLLDAQRLHAPPAGALLFSCNGRGTRLFDTPCHDIAASRRAMPQTPTAGFFAAGELGPVGGRSFIHGHTASFAIFRDIEEVKG
jgi:small ligand-binding sensory domain FIST